jgi:hypothetical protein
VPPTRKCRRVFLYFFPPRSQLVMPSLFTVLYGNDNFVGYAESNMSIRQTGKLNEMDTEGHEVKDMLMYINFTALNKIELSVVGGGAEQLSRYSDLLRPRWRTEQTPMRARFSAPVLGPTQPPIQGVPCLFRR